MDGKVVQRVVKKNIMDRIQTHLVFHPLRLHHAIAWVKILHKWKCVLF